MQISVPVASTVPSDPISGLTRREIEILARKWIGVTNGYLGDFGYRTHAEFWLDTCDLEIDTNKFQGTTREHFQALLFECSIEDQSRVVREILRRYPLLGEGSPESRTAQLERDISSWLARIELGRSVVPLKIGSSAEVVRRALVDADSLLKTNGPQSAVDRMHTALHGHLVAVCSECGRTWTERPTMNVLLKAIREDHPAFSNLGPGSEHVSRVLYAMGTILDALNPLRNANSVAHPNELIVEEPEALLVVNAVRTILDYVETRRAKFDLRLSP